MQSAVGMSNCYILLVAIILQSGSATPATSTTTVTKTSTIPYNNTDRTTASTETRKVTTPPSILLENTTSSATAENSTQYVASSSSSLTTKRREEITETNPNKESNEENENHENNTEQEGNGEESGEGVELVVLRWKEVEYPLIITLVVIFSGLSKLAFHYSHFLSSKVPESCVLIVIGVLFGLILYYTGVTKDVKLYAPHLFFLYLLPPIILEAAYGLYDRTFAENIGGVLLFAVIGTVLNCFLIGFTMYGLLLVGAMEDVGTSLVQMLLFTALIVAVDPVAVLAVFQEVGVNDMLYFLVFGESLLNDGVTVVLYDVMQIFITMPTISVYQMLLGVAKFVIVVVCGLIIGIACGIMSSYITKFTNTVKVVEPLIVFGFAYLSYVLSDMFEFSGIISIIACGIVQVHYTFQNITKKSRQSIRFFSKVMSNASEIIVFLDLGIVTINLEYDWKTGFSLWALLLCIVYRFIVTFILSAFLNRYSAGRVRKIKLDEMFMISYGGLRGAVCFSLVALISESAVPMKNLFVTTTLFIIFFTVFVQGGSIKWLVKKLRVKLAEGDPDMNLNKEISSHVFDYVLAGVEQIAGYTTGDHHIKKKLDKIDERIIKPKVLRRTTRSELEDISRLYEKLVMKEHYKNLQSSRANLRQDCAESARKLEHKLSPGDLGEVEVTTGNNSHETLITKIEHKTREENLIHGSNIHKFLGHTMDTVRDRMHIKPHGKNTLHEIDEHVGFQLYRKRRYSSRSSLNDSSSSSEAMSSRDSASLSDVYIPVNMSPMPSTSSVSRQVSAEKGFDNKGCEIEDDAASNDKRIVFTL